jgi:hypothetical protein
MPFIPKRPPGLAHLSDEAAARVLSRHFGDIAKAAKDLGVDRKNLRRLTWHNPRILDAAHERMELFVHHMWGEAVRDLNSDIPRIRRRGTDRSDGSVEHCDHSHGGLTRRYLRLAT